VEFEFGWLEANYDYGMIIEILIQELRFFVFLMGRMFFQILVLPLSSPFLCFFLSLEFSFTPFLVLVWDYRYFSLYVVILLL
jgi:hypothetical protein